VRGIRDTGSPHSLNFDGLKDVEKESLESRY